MKSPKTDILRLRPDKELRAFLRSEAALRGLTLHGACIALLREARDAKHREAM